MRFACGKAGSDPVQVPDELVYGGFATLVGFVVALLKILWSKSEATEKELKTTRVQLQEVREEVVDIKASRDGFLKGVEKISNEVLVEVRNIAETPVTGQAKVIEEQD